MKPKINRKALFAMVGILIFLLVAAVVLLSIIIVSLASDRTDNTVTTVQNTTVARTDVPKVTSTVTTTYPDPFATTLTPVTNVPSTTTDGGTATTTAKPTTTTAAPTTLPGKNDYTYAPTVSETITVKNADGSVTKKGAFMGGSDAKVFLHVEWEAEYAEEASSSVKLTVKVYVQSHSIAVIARPGGLLSIGGSETTFTSPAITHESNDIHNSLICQRSVTLTKRSSAPLEIDIDAAWNFAGVYSGVSIDWLTAEGTIEI